MSTHRICIRPRLSIAEQTDVRSICSRVKRANVATNLTYRDDIIRVSCSPAALTMLVRQLYELELLRDDA